MGEGEASIDERWSSVDRSLLDLARIAALIEGEPAGWPSDLERVLHHIAPETSVEDHVDRIGAELVALTRDVEMVPKRYVGLAWWLYAELREFPHGLPGHERAVALADRWRVHLERAFGGPTITG